MPFVHSLVKSAKADKQGWCAAVELGESASHYISFVIPVDENGAFFSTYSCETVRTSKKEKSITLHELFAQGEDSFLLHVDDQDFWFVVKPALRTERRLPYIGKLKHPDFRFLFTEIEPEEPDKLDRLYDRKHTFIMGCDPFTHYLGIKKRA
jgi:hypothetical protein